MSKKTLIFVLKLIVAIATTVLTALGVSTLTACSVSKSVESVGKATIVTTDTTIVTHSGYLKFKK